MQENVMTNDERLKIYFNNRYLVDEYMKQYSIDKPNYEELYDAVIIGESYSESIKHIQHNDSFDFKTYAILYIKSDINNRINNKD